ncbi:MAG: Hsp70 family protein, partial [Bacteroidaceae bacterium]|nr:Hsp70 family protein [Bacteroidaceae bacterium]
ADKKEREKVDKLNQADSMIFQTENMLKESGDKIPTDIKGEVEAAVAKLKTAHQAQDLAAIDAAMNELQTAAGKMYQAQQQAGPQPGPDMNSGFGAGNTGAGGNNNNQQGPDIQDADFEEVK